MKHYKLLKDTLTVKAGAIFEEEGTFDDEKRLVQVTKDEYQFRPSVVVRDIINFNDWFEEIPEKYERWRAEEDDEYYTINRIGCVCRSRDTRQPEDNYRYNVGIYGRTKQELEAKLKYNVARQVLLDDAEGGKFVPGSSNNWYSSYCLCLEAWSTFSTWYYYPGAICFKSEEALLKSLKEHKDQWEIVRKYEMGEKR